MSILELLVTTAMPGLQFVVDAVAPTLLASTDSESGTGYLLFAGPIAGGGVYWALYRYYRNTDKSHQFETETRIEAKPVTGTDVKVAELRRTTAREIPHNNRDQHRARVKRVSSRGE